MDGREKFNIVYRAWKWKPAWNYDNVEIPEPVMEILVDFRENEGEIYRERFGSIPYTVKDLEKVVKILASIRRCHTADVEDVSEGIAFFRASFVA